MAKRIGKYKVSKRESALSLEDGGTIAGGVTLSGAATLSNATVKLTGIPAISESNVTATGMIFSTGSEFLKGGPKQSVQGAASTGSAVLQVLCIRKQ